MARKAELEQSNGVKSSTLDLIQETAEHTLRLVDSYLLMAQSEYGQSTLLFESVGVGSIIYDVAQDLQHAAKKANIEINYDTNDAAVMTNREGLKAAIWCLGDMAISQITQQTDQVGGLVSINVKKFTDNIRVVVLSSEMEVKNSDLKRARDNQGRAHQAFSSSSPDSGIRLAVADTLTEALGTNLTAIKNKNMHGIGFALKKSQQLQLV